MNFDWDESKAKSNVAKHGVTFAYAARVFIDDGLIEIEASHEGDQEVRNKAVGMIEGKLFTVVFTLRDGLIRMISARRSSTKERKIYGQG